MSRVDYGTVELKLGDEVVTLKPTLAAYQKIDGRMGGLRQAIESVSSMSIDSITYILAAGAGIGQKDSKDLAEKVFREGALHVLPHVTEYLMLLLNPTGKDDSEAGEPDEGE